jgi:Domain of unknown function (DUF4915)
MSVPQSIKISSEFSRGFADFLARHRVGLVCSTYQTGHLLFVGVRADGRPVPSAASFSRAMGLAAFPQRVYVGTATEVWRLENALRSDEIEGDYVRSSLCAAQRADHRRYRYS